MGAYTFGSRRLRQDDFVDDGHAARYIRPFQVHPEAMRRLIELLNEPDSERRLEEAELRQGMPAARRGHRRGRNRRSD